MAPKYTTVKQDKLYNLIDDPAEAKNLINEAEEIAKGFREKILEHMALEEAQQTRLTLGNINERIARLKASGRI